MKPLIHFQICAQTPRARSAAERRVAKPMSRLVMA
jgi:hypothetical protein